jgi:phage tail sheath protein FI
MAFQLSPGVNVSEIDLTNVVPAVSSSIGAFAGQFSWGPANKRILVDSENNLVARFGKPTDENFTAFFSAANFLAYTNNIRIVRAIDNLNTVNATAIAEYLDLSTLTANIISNTKNIIFSTDVSNYVEHGDIFVVDSVAYTANTISGSTVVVSANATYTANSLSVSSLPGTKISIANEDDYEINFPLGTQTKFGSFYARYPGDLGNSLTIKVCSSADGFIGSSVSANVSVNGYTVTFDSGTSIGKGDILTINSVDYEVDTVVSNTVFTTKANTQISGPVTVKSQWEYKAQFDSAPGTSLKSKGTNDEMHVIVIDTDGKFSGEKGTILEKFAHVSKAGDSVTDDGSPNYYASVIENTSKYIYVADHLQGSTNWGQSSFGVTFSSLPNYDVKLSGGVNAAPSTADIITSYDLFSNPDEVDISLIITGAANAPIVNSALDIAFQRKDCVAFISPLRADAVEVVDVDAIVAYRNTLTPSTSYSVMDSAWKYQFDKYNNKYRYVPLNADIAGLCARTDNIRDPWWSPAGFNRGQILNAIKLSWNPTKAQRDELYKNGVNPVCAFPGEGIVLYGDKTMQAKPSAFDRINVRRLFIVLEKSIAIAAKYSLFEFNDQFTRAQFVSIVEPFLRDVKGRRGIYDYKVVCDETNNTPEVIDTNRFVGDIYIKPARSINFIQLNFVAVRTGVDFSEIAGKF